MSDTVLIIARLLGADAESVLPVYDRLVADGAITTRTPYGFAAEAVGTEAPHLTNSAVLQSMARARTMLRLVAR